MARLHTFEVGYCTHPACVAVRGAGLGIRKFPARAYLIETRSGPYLWDTGYAEHFAWHCRGIYRPYRWVTPVHFDPDREQLVRQLASHGFAVGDLRGILLSHFHADHIAGLHDFPRTPLYASRAAVSAIRGLTGLSALRKAFIPGLLPTDFESRLRFFESFSPRALPASLLPFRVGFPVDPHGEIRVVDLPGHAEGHVGAFVLTDAGWELLAADAAWAPEGYTDLRGPAALTFLIQHRHAAYYDTLQRLHSLHRHAGVRIHLSHE